MKVLEGTPGLVSLELIVPPDLVTQLKQASQVDMGIMGMMDKME
jgi:hypothetical protein